MTTTIDGQEVEIKAIFPNNAFVARQYLEKYAVAGNDYAAWDDATSVAVAFCTDRQGTDLIASLGPFSMAAVGAVSYPGWYYYVVPASVTALLDTDTYRGTTIYQRVTAGANAELRVVTPLIVQDPRFAAPE